MGCRRHISCPCLLRNPPLLPRIALLQLAGLFATATFEGHIGISSLGACTAAAGDASDGFSIGQGAKFLLAWLADVNLESIYRQDASCACCGLVQNRGAVNSLPVTASQSSLIVSRLPSPNLVCAAASTSARTKAPAWLKRPCGATFGFGGKLVQASFSWGVQVETGTAWRHRLAGRVG